MNTLITGIDLILATAATGFDPRTILDVVENQWPAAVFQDAEETTSRSTAAVLADSVPLKSTEFFIFEDAEQADSWDQHGRTDDNANRMLHFLIAENTPQSGSVQITMVIDAFTPEMAGLFRSLHTALSEKRWGRVNYEEELRSAGSTLTRAEFYDLVEGLRLKLYPSWSQDELACHPHDAAQFCNIVRLHAKAPLPDNVIMKAVLNRRKQK
jgi:hypothetical protein